MDESSQKRLASEWENWLNRGRSRLLRDLLIAYRPMDRTRLAILELGAGAGQNTKVLSKFGAVDAVEVSSYFADRLATLPTVRNLYREPIPNLTLERRYDVLCAMDVLEHIEDEAAAMDWIFDHLADGGVFIATVPAYQWLFSDHDRANHHCRRYTQSTLSQAVAGRLRLRRVGYFNSVLFPVALVGRAAWQAKRTILGKAPAEGKQSSRLPAPIDNVFRNILFWEAKRISKGASPRFGLSVFCVAERSE